MDSLPTVLSLDAMPDWRRKQVEAQLSLREPEREVEVPESRLFTHTVARRVSVEVGRVTIERTVEVLTFSRRRFHPECVAECCCDRVVSIRPVHDVTMNLVSAYTQEWLLECRCGWSATVAEFDRAEVRLEQHADTGR